MLIDVLPVFGSWLARIHIGRYGDRRVWSQAITGIGLGWLRRTPTIKVTDNTRLIVMDMLRGNYSRSAIQHWQEAALLLGMQEQLSRGNNQDDIQIRERAKNKLSVHLNASGDWKKAPGEVDGAILAYSILKWNRLEPVNCQPAMDQVWELLRSRIGEEGTVQYRKAMSGYRYVDTIGFICPFLVRYGLDYNKPECLDLAVRQILEYEQHGMLPTLGVPFHAYSIKHNYLLGLHGWGRGLGWYAIGLIDAWNELPEEHEAKKVLQDAVVRFAHAAVSVQGERGQWNWTVTRTESRADSSATAMLAWFMGLASQIPEISQMCEASFDRAVTYLMSVTRRNGAVDFSQGDTKDIGVYSTLFELLPFTQGFCIRIAAMLQK